MCSSIIIIQVQKNLQEEMIKRDKLHTAILIIHYDQLYFILNISVLHRIDDRQCGKQKTQRGQTTKLCYQGLTAMNANNALFGRIST